MSAQPPEWRVVDGKCEGCGTVPEGVDRDGKMVTVGDHVAAHRRGWERARQAGSAQ